MKRITLLGSTGSIGRSCLDIVNTYPKNFKIVGLSTHHRVDLLYEQCLQFQPEIVCISGEDVPLDSFEKIKQLGITITTGKEGLTELASLSGIDLLVNGLVGSSGLMPTLAAINQKIDIALANKETLVMAGEIVTALAREKGVKILPVDSEHSAIFQCLQGESTAHVSRLILTASGGPFQKLSLREMEHVTVDQALRHPNWCMGNKVTIDSATMMNKGLEVIEAYWLFQIPFSQIEVLVHPQSIVHSMVEFVDGSVKAQMGTPDMRIPIQYAMTYPNRKQLNCERMSLNLLNGLTFERPDFHKFPACALAYESLEIGGTAPAVLNAANEIAVNYFVNQKIKFNTIPRLVEETVYQHKPVQNPNLEDVLAADMWARGFVKDRVENDEVLVVAF